MFTSKDAPDVSEAIVANELPLGLSAQLLCSTLAGELTGSFFLVTFPGSGQSKHPDYLFHRSLQIIFPPKLCHGKHFNRRGLFLGPFTYICRHIKIKESNKQDPFTP